MNFKRVKFRVYEHKPHRERRRALRRTEQNIRRVLRRSAVLDPPKLKEGCRGDGQTDPPSSIENVLGSRCYLHEGTEQCESNALAQDNLPPIIIRIAVSIGCIP
ncbi:hypothetical protein LshimejAT787_1200370 [Lyophyllum shimeji]|uniref:Uncharacterized protein n=1 Tax=Lyophyllum shimeji TaxID=47721 RepID=A0A9P3PVY7_LYOSH|nr:hypothetical protein LshimejAT787_1200370 [Lyophyllum shimeji]